MACYHGWWSVPCTDGVNKLTVSDFNSSPCEAPYQLLVNPSKPLLPAVRERLEESRMVHVSVDKIGIGAYDPTEKPVMWSNEPAPETESVATSANGTGANTPVTIPVEQKPEKDDEGEAEPRSGDPKAKERPTEARDGILGVEELQRILRGLVGNEGLRSAYDVAKWSGKGDDTFASRDGWPEGAKADKGGDEPGYTCFTGLFQLTLGISTVDACPDTTDYLFIVPPMSGTLEVGVRQILRPAKKEELGKGLPMKGTGASDHLAVGCEVAW
jgi:RNA exonuclease NGL2